MDSGHILYRTETGSTKMSAWTERHYYACKTPRSMYPSSYNSFPVIRTTIAKNRHFYVPGLHFLFALGTPLWHSGKTLHEWNDNSVLAKPLAACTHLSSTVSQLFEPQVQKIAIFTYRRSFPLETPLRLSRNMLHGWKENSMLAKPLATCTHLSSTVSQLFELQVQKIAIFTYRSPHFLYPLETPLGQSR